MPDLPEWCGSHHQVEAAPGRYFGGPSCCCGYLWTASGECLSADLAELLSFDTRLRCQCCSSRPWRQCARKATQEDARCDDCRGDDHERRFSNLFWVPIRALASRVGHADEVLNMRRGHVVLRDFPEDMTERWWRSVLRLTGGSG